MLKLYLKFNIPENSKRIKIGKIIDQQKKSDHENYKSTSSKIIKKKKSPFKIKYMRKKSFKMSDIIEITATFKIFSAKNISKFAFQHVLMICANMLSCTYILNTCSCI